MKPKLGRGNQNRYNQIKIRKKKPKTKKKKVIINIAVKNTFRIDKLLSDI